jgi:hypothetical protein
MADRVASHYSENLKLADVIAQNLQRWRAIRSVT